MSAEHSPQPAAAPTTVVIGGGMSGLIYAWELARAGYPVTVVEADAHVGGAVWSHSIGGVESHTGAEAFAIGRGAVLGLVNDLGLADSVVSPATGTSFIVTDTGAYASPTNAIMGMPARPLAADVRRALGLPGALRAWAERLLPARYGLTPGVSIGAFVQKRYGRRVLEQLVAPIIQGVHSADPHRFELAAVMPTLPAAVHKHGSAQKAIEHMLAERGTRSGSGAAVHSLTPSMAALPKALAAQITEEGGRILTGSPVSEVATDGARWHVSTADGTQLEADRLVVAVGPEVARTLLAEAAPEVAALVPTAPATPVRLASLALDNPELDQKPRGNGVLVAPGTRSIRAKAMTHASAKWEHIGAAAREVAPGRHVVRLSYGRGASAESVPEASEFPDLAVRDAARILGIAPERLRLVDWAITDWVGTMRQTGPGHTAALAELDAALAARDEADAAPLLFTGAWRAGNGLEAITRFTRALAQASTRPQEEAVS